jgi:hypothetical protein
MAQFTYRAPSLVGTANLKEPLQRGPGVPLQNATWRAGDILINKTAGTIVAPPATASTGSGTLANSIAPGNPGGNAVTITQATTAGASAQTYYILVTNTYSGGEGPPSQLYVVNCPVGKTPAVTAASAGAPGTATNFAVYAGIFPNSLSLQQATKTTTALGSAYTLAAPLTNSVGWAQAVTGSSSNIIGLAINDSNAVYFSGGGGSFSVGNQSIMGATSALPPLTPFEAPGAYAIGLGNGQQIEMSLVNTSAWSDSLLGAAIGLTLDATTGFFIADPGQTQVGNIVGHRDGAYIGPTGQGTNGDTGVRVIVSFLSSVLG